MAASMNFAAADCINYLLFPKVPNRDEKSVKQLLEEVVSDYMAKIASYLAQYIWQNEPFHLQVVHDLNHDIPPHLEGTTCVGDNIEDEWFIVFLLFQLSKEDPNLVIKVHDSDGEFLLIEAAEHLPKWINPETAENRVYIHKGSIHIIPNSQFSQVMPPIVEALHVIRDYPTKTQASPQIQSCIEQRIKSYPEKIRQLQHIAHCYLPASAAVILNNNPQLVAHAVQAFYLRDPLDLKACRAMKYFPPETRVMTQVRFTRCLYAQLVQQKYHPDRKTGWQIPPPNSPQFKSYDLGMKLACGFEILAASTKSTTEESDDDELDVSDVRWKRFVYSLTSKGFFKGEVEGSKLYQQLLSKAKTFYCQMLKKQNKQSFKTPGQRIIHLLRIMEVDMEALKDAEEHLDPPDDDSWMEITPQDLDQLLKEYAGHNEQCNSSEKDWEIADKITGGLKAFVSHTSGLEGAEIPEGMKIKAGKGAKDINFDPESFHDAVNAILDFKVPESDNSSSSGMSDYSDEDDDHECVMRKEGFEKGNKSSKGNPLNMIEDMKLYMEQMDRELSRTNVGLTFERSVPMAKAVNHETPRDEKTSKSRPPPKAVEETLSDEEVDDYRPVDVDLTTLKNILESYNCQQGMPGPASNILSSMGIQIPPNEDTT